jgi:hypothetical protein
MNTYEKIVFLLGVVLVLTFMRLEAYVFAADISIDDLATLRGLRGLAVAVGDIDPEIEREGLTQAELRRDMEVKLQLAGIEVLSKEARRRLQGAPAVYLYCLIQKGPMGYFHEIVIQLREQVRLLRKPDHTTYAVTWANPGIIGRSSKLSDVRASAGEVVDMFIDAYFAANPKSIRKTE